MKQGLVFIGLSAALACAVPGKAAETDAYCTDRTQLANDLCSDERYKAANAKMSKLYGQLIASLKKSNENSRLTALETAQKVWEQFRDAECRFVGLGFEGGSMAPMVESDCLTHLTEVRTQQISSYIHCDIDKDYLCEKPSASQRE